MFVVAYMCERDLIIRSNMVLTYEEWWRVVYRAYGSIIKRKIKAYGWIEGSLTCLFGSSDSDLTK